MPQRWTMFFAAAVLVVATTVVGTAQQEFIEALRAKAEQGDAASQFGLGGVYELMPELQDYAEAARWYRLAADQGLAASQVSLGQLYADGRGVLQDDMEAIRWFRLGAAQGHPGGFYRLALHYRNGIGVLRDLVLAHKWANLATARYADDHPFLSYALELRDEIANRLTPDQRAEGQRLAREWTARVTVPSISPRIEDVPPSGSEGGKGGTEQQINITEVLRSREFRLAVARVVSEDCHYTGVVAPGPVRCFAATISTRRSSTSSAYAELLGSQEFRRAVARIVGNGGCNYMGVVNFGSGIIPPGPIYCVGIGRSTLLRPLLRPLLRRPGSALLRSQEFGPAVARVVNNNCNFIGGVIMSGGFIPPGPIDCGAPR